MKHELYHISRTRRPRHGTLDAGQDVVVKLDEQCSAWVRIRSGVSSLQSLLECMIEHGEIRFAKEKEHDFFLDRIAHDEALRMASDTTAISISILQLTPVGYSRSSCFIPQ